MDKKVVYQKIEQFYSQVREYRDLCVESLANYIGIDVHTLLDIFPRREWQTRKDEWVLQRLREVMEEIYPSAKIQQDFSARRISRIVGVDPDVLYRLVGDEFQQRRAILPVSHYDENFIRPALEQFFAKVVVYEEVSLEIFARFVGLDESSIIHILQRVFPPHEWQRRKDEWTFQYICKVMDKLACEARTQADFSVQSILALAKVSRGVFDRLAADSFVQWRAMLGERLVLVEEERRHELNQAANRFFAQVKAYRETTIEQFATFVGQDLQVVVHIYSVQRWKEMRDEWANEQVRKAMNDVYQRAKYQSDFSVLRIAQSAGMHPNVISRLGHSEYFQRKATLPMGPGKLSPRKVQQRRVTLSLRSDELESLRENVQQYFARAEMYNELSIEYLAASIGTETSTLLQCFTFYQLQMMRNEWCLKRILLAMDEVYSTSERRTDFSRQRIAEKAGVPPSIITRLALAEFRKRRATLPTALEKLLSTLKALVDADTLLADFSQERVYELAGGSSQVNRKEFIQAYREAYMELTRRQSQLSSVTVPPSSEENDPCFIGEKWIDLASSCWELRPEGFSGSILKRDRLRDDFAEIAWSLLQEDIRSGQVAIKTIIARYYGFIYVGELLSDDVPDFSLISLEAVQRAWFRYPGTLYQKKWARVTLKRLLSWLVTSSELDVNHDSYQELLHIDVWLGRILSLPGGKPGEEFLSDAELTTLLQRCLADIQNGISFIEKKPDLLLMDTRRSADAYVVVQWTVALMIILMAFTGLRSQSVVLLEIDDWMEIRSGLFALVWHHGKKREENLAVLPAVLAQQLDLYVYYTASVRQALGTKRVFLNGTAQGLWKAMSSSTFAARLRNLVESYHLERNGVPLLLGSTVLRRTFTTRALYEGQSLEALRLQLGHANVQTTRIYAHFDRSEHPNQVREALDLYGRQSLKLWQTPLMLDQLLPEERLTLLKAKVERQQDVGYCRHHYCIKAKSGSPPPCSLCEHLVTGPEFLGAWKQEQTQREQELLCLTTAPDAGLLLAQMKCQFEHFQANFAFIQKECNT